MPRTQQQRREETVARLLDASIDAIAEMGYARTSAAVICKRAGVSVGALFRHFDTMGDFMAATAYELLRREVEEFTKRVAEIPSDADALEAALTILQDITASRTNTVMYELAIAARTDEKIRAALRSVLEEYTGKIFEVAQRMPWADAVPAEQHLVLTAMMLNLFDGAAIMRVVLSHPDVEAQRIPVLASLLRSQLS